MNKNEEYLIKGKMAHILTRMDDLKVTGFADWDDSGKIYPEYKPQSEAEWEYVTRQIAQILRENNYHWSGDYHQNGIGGAPVLANGEQVRTYKNEWGDIMAKAYPDEIDNSDGMGFCLWAMDCDNKLQNELYCVPEEDNVLWVTPMIGEDDGENN